MFGSSGLGLTPLIGTFHHLRYEGKTECQRFAGSSLCESHDVSPLDGVEEDDAFAADTVSRFEAEEGKTVRLSVLVSAKDASNLSNRL